MSVTVTAVAVLAHGAELAKGTVPSNDVTPGVLGFLVVAGMGIILYFLLRSMNRQLRKIPPPPPEDDEENAGAPPVNASPAPRGDPAG
jgi:hypothetical protein